MRDPNITSASSDMLNTLENSWFMSIFSWAHISKSQVLRWSTTTMVELILVQALQHPRAEQSLEIYYQSPPVDDLYFVYFARQISHVY